jgi:hypothetical protein
VERRSAAPRTRRAFFMFIKTNRLTTDTENG